MEKESIFYSNNILYNIPIPTTLIIISYCFAKVQPIQYTKRQYTTKCSVVGNISLISVPQYISKVGCQRRKAGRLIDVIILPPQQSHPTAGCSLYREETTEDHGIVPNGGEEGAVKYRPGGSGHNHRIGSARGVERTDAAPDATDDTAVEEGEYSIGGYGAERFVRCQVGNTRGQSVPV